MTPEELISEGRKLQRPCSFLRPVVNGPPAAIWYEAREDQPDRYPRLTVDARHIPGLLEPIIGYLTILVDADSDGGRVDVSPSWPTQTGIALYAHPAQVLPPIDAVFMHGSDAVGKWLTTNKWERDWAHNDNFFDSAVADAYIRVWQQEFPLYLSSDIFAMVGGWHFPWPDGDWHKLINDHLLVTTFLESEPWIEAWKDAQGAFRVFQRVT